VRKDVRNGMVGTPVRLIEVEAVLLEPGQVDDPRVGAARLVEGRGLAEVVPSRPHELPGHVRVSRDGAEYLDMLHPRLKLMHQLLSPTGTLYLHLDWHINHYMKVEMDKLFGYHCFQNEIIWSYRRWPRPFLLIVYTGAGDSQQTRRCHDPIRTTCAAGF